MSPGFYSYFKDALKNYTNETIVVDRLWNDVSGHYTASSRHYHTLKHLDALINELTEVRKNIADWDLSVFAIAYHNIIYKPLKMTMKKKALTMLLKFYQAS